MPSSSVVYKSIKTTKALEYIQDSIQTGNPIELLGFSVSSVPGAFDPSRTLSDLNRTWYPQVGDYTNFDSAPSSSGTVLTLIMKIPAAVTTQEVFITEFYIHARYRNEVFLFAIGQTQTDPVDFKYIPNTAYTLTMTFDLTQFQGTPTLIINQVDELLVEPPLLLDDTGTLSLEFEETLGVRNGQLTVPAVTNFIATKVGTPSKSGRTITLPKMKLYIPDGRNSDNTIKNEITTINSSTWNIDDDLDTGSTHPDDTYYLFYDNTEGSEGLHLTTNYSKHAESTPTSGNFGDVVYREDLNQMQTVSNVAPNYTLSNGAQVSNAGVVSDLGTVSLNISNRVSIPEQFKVEIPFTTGTVTSSSTQILAQTPFVTFSISSSTLNADITSYAYGVDYYPIKYTGGYSAGTTDTINIINLQGTNYCLSSGTIADGDTIYVDKDLQVPYGTIYNLNVVSGTTGTLDACRVVDIYSGTYEKEYTGAFYEYLIGGLTFYTNTALATNVQLYLDDTMQSYLSYQKVTSVSGSTVSFVQYVGGITSSQSGTGYYSYTLDNGTTLYTSDSTLTIGTTIFYQDSDLTSNYYGKLTAVVGTDYTIECQGQAFSLETYQSYLGIYRMGSSTYYVGTPETSNLLPLDTPVYTSETLSNSIGKVTAINASDITIQDISTLYSGNYILSTTDLYNLTLSTTSAHIYTTSTPSAGDTCYDENNNEYGIIESIDSANSTIVIHDLDYAQGYVAEAPVTIKVPQGSIIYLDSDLTLDSGSTSTGENTFYNDIREASPLGRISISVANNTSYDLVFTTSNASNKYSMKIGSTTQSITSTRLPYKGIGNFNVYLGDYANTYNFGGTVNLTNLKVSDLDESSTIWEWNGHATSSPDWNTHLLVELGTVVLYNNVVNKVKLNQSLEFAKFTDLSSNDSNSRHYGQLIFTSLPIIGDPNIKRADGQIISASENSDYKKFVDYIASLCDTSNPDYNTYSTYVTTDANVYQQYLNTYGAVGLYYYNPTAQTVQLPKLSGIIESSVTFSNTNGKITPRVYPTVTSVASTWATSFTQPTFQVTIPGAGWGNSGVRVGKGHGGYLVVGSGNKEVGETLESLSVITGNRVLNCSRTGNVTFSLATSVSNSCSGNSKPQSCQVLVYVVIKI